MTQTKLSEESSRSESSGSSAGGGSDATEHADCHETVSPATRKAVLERDNYRCTLKGEKGKERGGYATLQVHHIERDPEGMEEHAMANLITLCRACHSWHHQQTSEEAVPVALTDADAEVLLPHDREILQVLDRIGPAMTADVASALSADLSVIAVRERLWTLMGLDATVEDRDTQIVDQDATSGEFGLTGQIASSERGRIPDASQTLLKRAADERVRQALDRGCDRSTVADVFGIHERTTWIKQKRARAYGFPLDAVSDQAGGRPPADDRDTESNEPGEEGVSMDSQPECADSPGIPDEDRGEGGADSRIESDERSVERRGSEVEGVRSELRQAITALETVVNSLEEA
jgi:hypothetical protein